MQRFNRSLFEVFPDLAGDFQKLELEGCAWESRFRTLTDTTFPAADADAHRRGSGTAWVLMTIYSAEIASRCVNLANGIVRLVNGRNAHSAPAVTRALVETCCIPLYMERELLPRLKKCRTDQVHRLVFRLGLGSTRQFEVGYIKPIEVSSLIRSARAALDDLVAAEMQGNDTRPSELIDLYYSTLTELSHPNFAAMKLSSEAIPGDPVVFELQPDYRGEWLWAVASPAAFFLHFAGRAIDDVAVALNTFPMELSGEPNWEAGDLVRAPSRPDAPD